MTYITHLSRTFFFRI